MNENIMNNSLIKMFAEKLLVIVPHPDDELIIAGPVIRNHLLCGGEVFVCFSTAYNICGEQEAECRTKEIYKIYDKLNISRQNIIFLNFPVIADLNGYKSNEKTISYSDRESFFKRKNGREQIASEKSLSEVLLDVISHIQPNHIICIDKDVNYDHIMLSNVFDGIVHELINRNYVKGIYKAYAYEGAWKGPRDFYCIPLKNTLKVELIEGEIIRIPYIYKEDVSFFIRGCWLYSVLKYYRSQNAISHMNSVINSDVILLPVKKASTVYDGYKIVSGEKKEYLYKLFAKKSEIIEFDLTDYRGNSISSDNFKLLKKDKGEISELYRNEKGLFFVEMECNDIKVWCECQGDVVDEIDVVYKGSLKYVYTNIIIKLEKLVDYFITRVATHLYTYKRKNK